MASTLLPPSTMILPDRRDLQDDFWDPTAPKKVVKAYQRDDAPAAWSLWQAHLATRKTSPRLEKLLQLKRSPLLWSCSNELANSAASPLQELLTSKRPWREGQACELPELLASWLKEQPTRQPTATDAWESLALAYSLPRLAAVCDADLWWRLVSVLQQTAHDAAALQWEEATLATLWLNCELPLALAYALPEITPLRNLWAVGSFRLSAALEELLDGEGLPHARRLEWLRPLLACCTRAAAMAQGRGVDCFDETAKPQYPWLIRRALELTRRDGRQLLTPGTAGQWEPELFAAALQLGGQRRDRDNAIAALPGVKASARKRVRGSAQGECSNSSEWAALALLRSGWSPKSPRMLVKYDQPQVELELETSRGLIFSGIWEVELELAGKRLEVVGPWEENCWQSDHDVVYVELEASLPGGLTVQRQILLARDEEFLLMADAVLSPHRGPITYRAALPLAAGSRFEPEAETREGYLSAERQQALVLPLALPEWRIDPRHGELAGKPGRLCLTQSAEAANLFCPLLFDLKPNRLKKLRTWRQLTVAENRVIQPAETCVGYRAQCGADQWFFYRSLGPKGNRTLLSHNLVSEFLAARFETDGTIEELLEIE